MYDLRLFWFSDCVGVVVCKVKYLDLALWLEVDGHRPASYNHAQDEREPHILGSPLPGLSGGVCSVSS